MADGDRQYTLKMGLDMGPAIPQAQAAEKAVLGVAQGANRANRELATLGKTSGTYAATTKTATSSVAGLSQTWVRGGSSAAAYSTGASKATSSTQAWTAAGRGTAAQLGAVTSSSDRAASSALSYKSATDQATAANERSTTSFTKLAGGVVATITAYVGMSQAIAVIQTGARAAEDWSKAMLQVSTLADVSRETVQGWEGALKSLVTETGRAPTELSASILRVTSAGLRGAEAMDVTTSSAKAAAVGLGQVGVIAQAVTAAMNAYGPEVLSASRATDILLQTVIEGAAEADTLAPALGRVVAIAAQLGVGFDEVGGFLATFTRLGVDADEAVTALRGTLTTMLGPTKQQTEALATVGLTMADLRKEINEKGLARGLVDLVKRFKGNDDALAAIIPNVRALAGVLGTAGAQAEQFGQIEDNITNSTGALDRKFAELQGNPAFRAEQARAGWALFQQELGGPVLRAVLDVGDAITDSLGGDAVTLGRKVGEEIAAGIELAKPFIVFLIANLRLIRDVTFAWLTLKVSQWLAETVSGLAVLIARLATATTATSADTVAQGANAAARLLNAGAAALVAEKTLLYESASIRATITAEASALAASQAAVAEQAQAAAAVDLAAAQSKAAAANFFFGNSYELSGNQVALAAEKQAAYQAATVNSTVATNAAAVASAEATAATQAQAVATAELASAKKSAAAEVAFFSTSLTALAVGLTAVVGALLVANSTVKQFAQDAENAAARMVNAVQQIGQEANKLRTDLADLRSKERQAAKLRDELLKAGVTAESVQGQAIQLRILADAQSQYVDELRQKEAALTQTTEAIKRHGAELVELAAREKSLNAQIAETRKAIRSPGTDKEELADLTAEFARLGGELNSVRERTEDVERVWDFNRNKIFLLEKSIAGLNEETSNYRAPAQAAASASANLGLGTDKAGDAAKKAQAEHDRLAASLRALQDQLDPLGAENRKYADSQALVTTAVASRIVSENEAAAILKQLAKDHADSVKKILADLDKLKAVDAQKIWADLFPPADGVTFTPVPAGADVVNADLINGDSWGRLNAEIRDSGIGVQKLTEETITYGSVAKEAASEFGDGVGYALQSFIAGIRDGEADIGDFWDGVLDAGLNAIAQLFSEWITIAAKEVAIWVKKELAKTAITVEQAAIRKAADKASGTSPGSPGGTPTSAPPVAAGGGAGAAALGTVAVFAVIYLGVSSWIRTHRREWAELTVSGHGAVSTLGTKKSVAALTNAMSEFMDGIRSFVKSIGGEFVSLQKDVTVGSRGQGKNKSYYVKLAGEVLANFGNDIEAALEFAAITALKNSETKGLSPLVKEAIQKSLQTTVEGFQREIEQFTEIANLGVPDAILQVRTTTAHLDELRDALISLNSVTPAVIEGFANLQAAELAAWQSSRDAITGRERTVAEDLALRQTQAVAWNAELQYRRASIALMAIELRAKIELLRASGGRGGSGGRPGQGAGDAGNAAGGPSNAVLVFANSMVVTGKVALATAGVMTSAAEAQLAALNAQLEALQALQVALDAIPLIDLGEIVIPRGGGGNNRDDAKKEKEDFIRSLELIARSSLPAAVQAVLSLTDQIEEMEKKARELKLTEEQILKARQALIDQAKKTVTDPIKQWLTPQDGGTFGLSEWEKKSADIKKAFADARAANQKLLDETGVRAIAFWKLNQAELRALRELAQQAIDSLGLPMEQTKDRLRVMAETIEFLRDSVDAGTLSAAQFNDVMKQLGVQAQIELLGLTQSLLEQIGQTEAAAQLKRQADLLNFQLQRLQLNYLFQQYVALGLISGALQLQLQGFLDTINDPANWPSITAPPTNNTGTGSGNTGVNPFETLADFRKELDDQIREWTVSALGPFNREATDLRDRFANLTAEAERLSAVTGTSLLPELERLGAAYQVAVGRFVDDALAEWEHLGESELFRRSRELTEQFDDIRQSFITIGANAEQFQRLADAERRAFSELWRDATSDLRELVTDLRDSDPRVSSQLRFTEAQAEFRSLLARAQGGDIEAASQLGEAGRRYREQAQAFLGAGVGSNRVIDEILRAGSIVDGMVEAMDPVATRVDVSNRYLEGIYGALTGQALPLVAAVTGSEARPTAAALGLLGIRSTPPRGATPVAGFSSELDFAASLGAQPRTGPRKPAETGGGAALEEVVARLSAQPRLTPAKRAAEERQARAQAETLDDLKEVMLAILEESRFWRAERRKDREAGR